MNSDNKFILEKNLYNEDSPLLILGGGISKTGDGNQYARIQFMNIGKNGISEVKVRLKLYENDLTMHISDVEYTYTSLNCARGKTFGDDDLISIKDSDVDSFKIEVISIEYADNSISKDVISNWEAMEFYNKLESTYSSEKAIEQYKKEFGNNAKFIYKKQGEFVVNDSENDNKTNMSAVSKYNTRYYHFTLTGLKKYESVRLSYTVYYTDGSTSSNEFSWDMTREYNTAWVFASYNTPAYAYTGIEKLEVYNKETGELIGSKTVHITN